MLASVDMVVADYKEFRIHTNQELRPRIRPKVSKLAELLTNMSVTGRCKES